MVFLYCLQMRRNVTFITSDEDVVNLVFGLTEALADNWCLKAQVLEMLTEKDKNDIMGNKKIELFVDPLVLAKKRMKVLGDMYDDSWKKKSFSFVLKFWSTEKQKYHNFDFTFNEAERMMFLNSHGQFNCPPR